MNDPKAESDYGVVFEASKRVRWLMSKYRINDGVTSIQSIDEATYEIADKELQTIRSLGQKCCLHHSAVTE